ncbi:ATP-binding domain-containing protein [Streptosporangiaceae bacterium NEAU-GS5]|nr:ATP-binding domain-containing protein [Streptosporangiaceae bacterium NEAU-GS5]
MAARQPESVKPQSSGSPVTPVSHELREEQSYVSMLYDRLDEARVKAAQAFRDVLAAPGGTRQALIEREVGASEQARRLAQLNAVERGLAFGRIDDSEDETLYIGRLGLRDDEHASILVDWRAPAARPFYAATAADPGALVRRRHLRTRGRTVVGLDDEVFDLDRMSEDDRRALVGEAALMAALSRRRTGRMGEVVATIQTEQDRVIRSGLQGTLVVQGGPGTGKTVAALHRAAYLLYTYRDVLERRGILVIGPNSTFLRYIEDVLPSLGETDVVMMAAGELYPGVRATEEDEPEAAVVKGAARMAGILAHAVWERQRIPGGDLEVAIPIRTSIRDGVEVTVQEMTLRVDHETCAEAQRLAQALERPHNLARPVFARLLLDALARNEKAQLDDMIEEAAEDWAFPDDFLEDFAGELDGWAGEQEAGEDEDLRQAGNALWDRPEVRAAIDALWPYLTPERLVEQFLADPDSPMLSPADRAVIRRAPGAPWTVGDVPLLDEAAELLGQDAADERAAARRDDLDRAEAETYALEVAAITDVGDLLRVSELMELAEQQRGAGPHLTTAERAAADRTWVYGHVVVDEAQELSAMAWRAVLRRVPTRSMTIVGDIAQTGSAAGARSWEEMLDPHLSGRWHEERLTINYRTPAEIMTVAAGVLRAVAPEQEPPLSVREGGDPPRAVVGGLAALPRLVREELAAVEDGSLAVIVPDGWRVPEMAGARVLTVGQSKGLEFDAVIVAAPDEIAAQSPKGGQDLYVALTRATRRLSVLYGARVNSGY